MSEYNLIVIGGGLSGVAAAVCAAREGLNVMLVERMGCLGGAMSNCSVYPFMKHAIKYADGTKRILSAGIFAEMCKRHRELGGVSERGWQPEIFKIMLDRLVEESSVKVMFHTQLIGLYFLIDPIDRILYGTYAFLVCFAFAALSWFFLLREHGYFDKLISSLPKREKKERLSKAERMRREIKLEKEQKSNARRRNGKNG